MPKKLVHEKEFLVAKLELLSEFAKSFKTISILFSLHLHSLLKTQNRAQQINTLKNTESNSINTIKTTACCPSITKAKY